MSNVDSAKSVDDHEKKKKKRGCCNRALKIAIVSIAILTICIRSFIGSHYYDFLFLSSGRYFASLLPLEKDLLSDDEPYDYENTESSWATHPDKLDWADIVPPDSLLRDEQKSSRAAVFFLYPTGYFGFQLNSPSNPSLFSSPLGVFGDLLADITGGMVHGSIYNGIGRVFTPRYRQASGWAFMLPENDSRRKRAFGLALQDVKRAFAHFLKSNPGSPFILAGHSQGSILLCELIKEQFQQQGGKKLENFVAAYLIGANIAHGDCGEVVHVCKDPSDLGCFVHYNVLLHGGDRSKFLLAPMEKNLTCVNPLSFVANEEQVEAKHNPGSRPFLRPFRVVGALIERFIHRTTNILNLMSPLEKGLFSAKCHQGVVWVNNHPEATGFWTTGVFPGMNVHGGESSMFYLATRLNAQHRLNAYYEQQTNCSRKEQVLLILPLFEFGFILIKQDIWVVLFESCYTLKFVKMCVFIVWVS